MKTVDEIYREMLSGFGERTGLEPREGCDLAVRLYAVAAQVYALYVQAEWVVRQAFPQTAEGQYLDRHAQLRGLERKPAVAAEGRVVFSALETASLPRDIPKGTVCMTAGLVRFETTEGAVLAGGETLVGWGAVNLLAGLGMAVFCTLLGHSVFSWGLKFLPPAFISTANLLEPVLASVWGLLLFDERPGPLVILGGGIILLGIALYGREKA